MRTDKKKRSRYEAIKERVARAYSHHTISKPVEQGHVKSYRWANPKESEFWAYITEVPGSVILTGDGGDLIVENKDLSWCAGVSDIGYFISKLSKNFYDEQEALPESVRSVCDRLLEEKKESLESECIDEDDFERVKEFVERWASNGYHVEKHEVYEFYESLSEIDDDAGEYRIMGVTDSILFRSYALLLFAEKWVAWKNAQEQGVTMAG